jgi:hypothetical protein
MARYNLSHTAKLKIRIQGPSKYFPDNRKLLIPAVSHSINLRLAVQVHQMWQRCDFDLADQGRAEKDIPKTLSILFLPSL